MALETFRMTRVELQDLLVKYEKAVQEDALNLVRPSEAEKKMLGETMVRKRAEAVRLARDANRKFVEAVVEDLPDFCSMDVELPKRPVAEFKCPEGAAATLLPSSSYGSMASVFLHLLRDWSPMCDHVMESTYKPAIQALRRLLPAGGQVLLPGAGLGRLAMELAAEGYTVEANDASRLFLTFADYVLNRAPADGGPIYPMAHVFSENWGSAQQYLEVRTPSPLPADLARRRSATNGASGGANGAASPAITLVPGDFAKTYAAGCAGHRKFDAIVTCFFIDTATDVEEEFRIMDGLLNEGGVWVNIGPLNWKKEARLKLSWDEIVQVWEQKGYEFVTRETAECDYHLARGLKMYTESYSCALTAAVKRKVPLA